MRTDGKAIVKQKVRIRTGRIATRHGGRFGFSHGRYSRQRIGFIWEHCLSRLNSTQSSSAPKCAVGENGPMPSGGSARQLQCAQYFPTAHTARSDCLRPPDLGARAESVLDLRCPDLDIP